MSGRLRTMLPPWWLIAAAVSLYAITDAIYAVAILQGFDEELRRTLTPRGIQFHSARAVFLVVPLVAWAIWRIARFHPLIRPGYFQWLKTTPWKHPQPLPLGPVLPSWEDAVLIALVTGVIVWRHPEFDPLLAPMAYLLVWSLAASALLFATGVATAAFGVWFGAALFVKFFVIATQSNASAAEALAVSILMAAVAIYGMHRSFATFDDWRTGSITDPRRTRLPHDTREIDLEHLGWPAHSLNPQRPTAGINYIEALAWSLLAGWWCFWLPVEPDGRWALPVLAGIISVVVRLFRYLAGYSPPISILGRIGTGRLVIPGYDRVLLTPAIAIAAGVGIPIVLEAAEWDARLGLSLATTATLLASLRMGPTLAEWRLTGEHRIVPRLFT